MAESVDKGIQVEYIPPPPALPGKIHVKAPVDRLGTKLFPDLHLSPELAEQLQDALSEGLRLYMESTGG